MKICGVLSWYDESPSWLATAVSGFARVCDLIVAVDGAYALYPGARPMSHPSQAEAIMGAAESAGIGCTIHRPRDLFYGNEVEKRNLTLRLAGASLEPGRDWLVIFDADCHVFKINPEVVRWELEHTDADLASYTVLDGQDYLADADLARFVSSDDFPTEWTSRTKDIYRWDPTLRYGPQHWTVSRERNGQREWVRSSMASSEDELHLNASLAVYHRTQDRTLVRRQAQKGYYDQRETIGAEPMIMGSPAENGVTA